MKQQLIALFIVIVMVASAFTALGLATTTAAAAAKKNADDVTFTVTDEQGHVLQQTHPVKADANVQPVLHGVATTGKAGNTAVPQATGPVLVGVAPSEQWNRSYGGAGTDGAYSVRQTTDGGYVLAGLYNQTASGMSGYLVKTSPTGTQQWALKSGSQAGFSEVQQTTDGGYILVGTYNTTTSGDQLWLLKTNATGKVNATQKGFSKLYGGPGAEGGYAVQQTSDGGYIAVGYTTSLSAFHGQEVYLLKVNAMGSVQWERTYGGNGIDEAYCVRQTADGGYVICGDSTSWTSSSSAYLIKTDKSGNIMYPGTWEQIYSDGSMFRQLVVTSDGYAVVGTSANGSFWLVKLATNGAEQFNKTFGGFGNSIARTSTGGYVMTGIINTGTDRNIYTVKTDAYGNTGPSYPGTWSRQDGPTGSGKDDVGKSVVQTKDGGYAITGYSDSSGNYQAVLYKLAPG